MLVCQLCRGYYKFMGIRNHRTRRYLLMISNILHIFHTISTPSYLVLVFEFNAGSCWVFASVATIESLNEITTGNLISLAEQEVLDCDVNGEDHGCNGGFADGAYQFFINNGGLTTEDNYPYVGYQENYCNGNVTISGYENVPNNDESSMQQAVANQPITVVLDTSDDGFRYYPGGVFTGPCGTATDHVVTVVGYDTASDGTPYWLIKNSWGTSWGENGYIRLQRDVSDPRGLCGVVM
ncbi:hypothetical protein Droror1_Dr00021421 [Drosera rotundifolia]